MKPTFQNIASKLLVVLILFSGSLALAWDHWDHQNYQDRWERHEHWHRYHAYHRSYYDRPFIATVEPYVEQPEEYLPFLAPIVYGLPRIIGRVSEPGISIYFDSGN